MTDYDHVVGVALNMPRGHYSVIHTRWPGRGVLASRIVAELWDQTDADAVVVGFSEFPTRALEPLRANGTRVTRAPANYRDQRDSIGNALGWQGPLRVQDRYGIRSLPYQGPQGRTVLTQPVRLMRTPGGQLVTIQVHPPTSRHAGRKVRGDLCEKVIHVAQTCEAAGLPVLVLGDLNGTHKLFTRAGAEVGALCDVQRVLGFGLEFGRSGVLPTHGLLTDHRGSPWVVARVPHSSSRLPALPGV